MIFAISTLFLCGLIWTIQIVHYPLFSDVLAGTGKTAFHTYLEAHNKKITNLVTVPWAIQGLSALALNPLIFDISWAAMLANWALSALLLVSTLFLQIPIHTQLLDSPTQQLIDRLVLTNWVRTAGWTGQGAIAVFWLI